MRGRHAKASEMQAVAKQVETYRKTGDQAKAHVDEVVATKALPAFLAGAKGGRRRAAGRSPTGRVNTLFAETSRVMFSIQSTIILIRFWFIREMRLLCR